MTETEKMRMAEVETLRLKLAEKERENKQLRELVNMQIKKRPLLELTPKASCM